MESGPDLCIVSVRAQACPSEVEPKPTGGLTIVNPHTVNFAVCGWEKSLSLSAFLLPCSQHSLRTPGQSCVLVKLAASCDALFFKRFARHQRAERTLDPLAFA